MNGKITQKAFVEAMVNNLTFFVGVSRKLNLNFYKSFFDEALPEYVNGSNNGSKLIEKRSCQARSKDLVFSDGSHLNISGREFYRVDGNCYTLYVCVERWIDKWDDKEYIKSMLYIVM